MNAIDNEFKNGLMNEEVKFEQIMKTELSKESSAVHNFGTGNK